VRIRGYGVTRGKRPPSIESSRSPPAWGKGKEIQLKAMKERQESGIRFWPGNVSNQGDNPCWGSAVVTACDQWTLFEYDGVNVSLRQNKPFAGPAARGQSLLQFLLILAGDAIAERTGEYRPMLVEQLGSVGLPLEMDGVPGKSGHIVNRRAKLGLTQIPCTSCHAGAMTLALSRSILARPNIWRLIALRRFIFPST
jgi:hypothetical protein